MSVQFTDGFGKDRPAELPLLNQPLRLREPAGIADRAVFDGNRMDHPVPIEEMVPAHWLKQRVSPVPDVHTSNVLWYSSDDRKVVADGLLQYRGEVPGDLDAGVGGLGEWVVPLGGQKG